jgi:hypothetical protein
MKEHKNQGLLTHLEIERRLLSIYSSHIAQSLEIEIVGSMLELLQWNMDYW